MRIESNRVSPFVSLEVLGSRTSLHVMPRIWQAAMNDRNVRVEGCVKYSIARRCGSKLMRKSCPARLFDKMRIISAMPPSSSKNGTENCPEKITWRIRPFRSNSGVFIRTGRCKRDSYSTRSRSSCVFGRSIVGALDISHRLPCRSSFSPSLSHDAHARSSRGRQLAACYSR